MTILDQIVLFGDSITEGSNDQQHGFAFASALQHAYRLRLDVINRGFGGRTTNQGLRCLPLILPAPSEAKIRFLAIFFGANDACLPPVTENPQHVPLPTFMQNLRAMISHPAVTAQSPRILLITPPPVEETLMAETDAGWGVTNTRRTAKNTALYAQAVRQVGAETGTVVVDVWTAMMEKAGYHPEEGKEPVLIPGMNEGGINEELRGFLSDGLHLTPIGYMQLFEEVMETIEKNWPDQVPDNLPSLRDL